MSRIAECWRLIHQPESFTTENAEYAERQAKTNPRVVQCEQGCTQYEYSHVRAAAGPQRQITPLSSRRARRTKGGTGCCRCLGRSRGTRRICAPPTPRLLQVDGTSTSARVRPSVAAPSGRPATDEQRSSSRPAQERPQVSHFPAKIDMARGFRPCAAPQSACNILGGVGVLRIA